MAYLVLGSSGYLGSRIVDFLGANNKVVSIGTNSSNLKDVKFYKQYKYENLSDKELENLVSQFKTVIDASGISSNNQRYEIGDFLEKNSIWPYRLAKVCVKNNSRLIWLSTIHCDNFDIEKISNFDKYSLSKFIGESLIKSIDNWDKKILILRLGNIVGAPGILYKGSSNLFAIHIASNLFKNKKAIIQNQEDVLINTTSISNMLDYMNSNKTGAFRCDSDLKFRITEIALCLKKHYEEITSEKCSIIFKGKFLKDYKELTFPNKINSDFRDLINYFYKSSKNSIK